MMTMLLVACVAPTLYESASPLLNPGESEPALYYEGPGVLVEGRCDGPGLALEVEPGGAWPHVCEAAAIALHRRTELRVEAAQPALVEPQRKRRAR